MSTTLTDDLETFQAKVLQEINEFQRLSGPRVRAAQGCFIDTMLPVFSAVVGAVIGYSLGNQSGIAIGILAGLIGVIGGGIAGYIAVLLIWAFYFFVTETLPELPKRYTYRRGRKRAKDLVRRRDIREYLCPALRSASNDVWEVAKVATPILYSLATAGTVSIPRDPVLFAAAAIVIVRMGIASLCADHIKK